MKIILRTFLILCLIGGLSLSAQVSLHAKLNALLSDSSQKRLLVKTLPDFEVMDSIYLENDNRAIFTRGMGAMYLDYLKDTQFWGFAPARYYYELLDSLYHSRDPKLLALFDIQAAQSYLNLYGDILNGLLKTEKARGENIHFDLERFGPYMVLNQIREIHTLNYLKLAEPNIESYQATKSLLIKYSQNQEGYLSSNIVFKDSLQLGDRDSMVINLREKLYFLGDLDTEHRIQSSIFDNDVASALKSFQKRNLLAENGILDKKTANQLNLPLVNIIQEMQVNMERWRWLPNSLGSYYALAIIPAFEMSLVKNDSLLLRQRMVCGKVSRKTPAFSATMSYIDINPTWTVPPTILQKDILPAVKRNNNYLSSKDIKVLDITTGSYISSANINWAKAGNYRFVQGPGLSNSLGVVKFMFPNNYYIFFHDTPHKEHFPLDVRAFSSGCVRLAQPVQLASVLLAYNKEVYSLEKIDTIIKTQKTKRILLEEQPVVYIHYVTQELKDGLFYSYPDIYGYNEELYKSYFTSSKN